MADNAPLSEDVLVEVLRQFVAADALPSERACLELAAAADVRVQQVRNYYTMAYQAAGGEGDPWAPPIAGGITR